MKSILMISLCAMLLFLSACGGGNETIPNDEKGRELFSAFHERFYRDSAFQMQRIEFPMLGSNPAGDNDNERFFWDVDNWTILKTVDPEDEDIDFPPVYDMGDLMRERIIVQKRFMIENLFSLINNKWYMTSFSGIKDIGTIVNPNQGKEETPTEQPIDSF